MPGNCRTMQPPAAFLQSVRWGNAGQPEYGSRMDQPKILVIDDDENITSFLKRALSYAGFVVATANSGVAGLQCALNNPPDVGILDVLMPEMDGWTVCGR